MKQHISNRLHIVAIALGAFASVMSTTVLSLAFPDIAAFFDVSYQTLHWRNVLFFSLFASGLPLFGVLADRIGARRQLAIGLSVFIASCVGSAFAPTWESFLFFQGCQALADAMLVPAQILLIRSLFPDSRLGWAFAWFGGILASAELAGPPLGGLVLANLPWQSLFGFLGCLSLAALGLVVAVIPRKEHAASPRKILPWTQTGLLFLFIFSAQGVFANYLTSTSRVAAVSAALLALLFFVVRERRSAGENVLPAGIFQNKPFTIGAFRVFLLFFTVNAIALFFPSYLRDAAGLPPATIGWLLMTGPLIAILAANSAGRAADSSPRLAIVCGLIVSAVGVIYLLVIPAKATLVAFFFAPFLLGLGGTIVSPAQDKLALISVPPNETGNYMGIFMMVQFSSGAFAAGLLGPLVESGQDGVITEQGFTNVIGFGVLAITIALLTSILEWRSNKVAQA